MEWNQYNEDIVKAENMVKMNYEHLSTDFYLYVLQNIDFEGCKIACDIFLQAVRREDGWVGTVAITLYIASNYFLLFSTSVFRLACMQVYMSM
jgi:hypothetical protein